MRIYIASSWKNQHGVEMLTALLRDKGHEVVSWVENNYGEHHNHVTKALPFHQWLETENAKQSFDFDTSGAATCDLLIFYTYAGSDAHAELAIAWTRGTPILGLYQKGYDAGLMSKMVHSWATRYTQILDQVEQYQLIINNRA
jgi:hypothetical protein